MKIDLELWLWAHNVVGLAHSLTDDELIAGIGGRDPARQAELRECLRDSKFAGRGLPPAVMAKIRLGEHVRAKQQRLWFVTGEMPARVAAILRHRAAQRERDATRNRDARNARDRWLYAESAERREKAKQAVYRWRKTNPRHD